MRPRRPYTPGEDQGSVDRRARFKFSAKLAQSIISVPDLVDLWKPVTPSGMTTYNYIIQKNVPLVNPASTTDLTAITPDLGFAVNCTNESIGTDAVAVAFAALGNGLGIDASKEPNVRLAFVISLTDPANIAIPGFRFIAGTSASQPTSLDTPLTFSIPLVGQAATIIGSYGEKKLFCTLIALDADNKPVKYSITVVK